MSWKMSTLALTSSVLLVVGCGAPTDEEANVEDGDSVGTLKQNFQAVMDVKRVYKSGGAEWARADCPSQFSYSFALGSAGWLPGNGMRAAGVAGLTSPNNAAVQATIPSTTTSSSATVTCTSPVPGYQRSESAAGQGNASVSCPANFLAVGGWGYCVDDSARLTRSRPEPANQWSTPTGWRASCSSGQVGVTVNCVHKGIVNSGLKCSTIKSDEYDGTATVSATPGDGLVHIVSAGVYCGNGGYVTRTAMDANLLTATASCSKDRVTAFAISCTPVNVVP